MGAAVNPDSCISSPRLVCAGALCHVFFRGAPLHGSSWLRPRPESMAAPTAPHRTAGARGPSPGMTAYAKTQNICLNTDFMFINASTNLALSFQL